MIFVKPVKKAPNEKKSDKFGIKLAQCEMKRKQPEEDERISLIRIGGKF